MVQFNSRTLPSTSRLFSFFKIKTRDELVKVYPNPALPFQKVTLEFSTENMQEQIILIDQLGRIVKRMNVETQMGNNTLTLDTDNLPVGIYHVQIVGSRTAQLLIIQE